VLNETEVLVIFNSIDEVLTRETDSKTLEGFNNSLDFCDIKWVEDIVDRVKWDPNDATLVVFKRLKVTKREAILVSIARIGSAPDPKSMQTNRIKGGVSEWVAGFKSVTY
jgi:hypothetical protein